MNEENRENQGTIVELKKKDKLTDRIRKGYHKFRATKAGRWTVRILKGAGAGAALFGAYKVGQGSVRPMTVYCDNPAEEVVAEVTDQNEQKD